MPFSFPASPSVGDQSTQNGRTYSWSGYAWEIVATPAALPASVITSGTLDIARIPTGTSSSTVCIGNDARLSDSRTPTGAAGGDLTGTYPNPTIAADAVTYAKIQNVSATNRLLGRSSSGAGDVEEIECTAFGRSLIDDADAATARTTLSVQPTASPTFTGTAIVSGTFQVKANSGSLSHAFNYNENGGEIALYTTSEVQASLIDHVGGTGTRILELVNGNDLYLGLGSGNTTGNVKIQRAGYVTAVTVSSTGTATFTGQILADDLTTSNSVVYGFDGDTNTGVGRGGADILTFVTNGTERVRVGSGGRVQFFAADEKFGLQINKGATGNGPFIGSDGADIFTISTAGGAERVRVKATGAVRFVPLSADPSTGNEAGDVYYNSTTNKLRVYNGTSWVDLH